MCISATSVTSDLRRYFLKICGHRQKANQAMIQGKINHENRQKDYKTLDEYSIKSFQRNLMNGKIIELKEFKVCSPMLGFRGFIDLLKIQIVENKVLIEISELKTGYSPLYILQLVFYGMMFSDRHLITYYQKKGRKKVRYMPFKVFPQGDLDVTILLFLENLTTEKAKLSTYMQNNIVNNEIKGLVTAVMKRVKERRKYHKYGIYYLNNFPKCKNCQDSSEYCSLWDICQKINYDEDVKTKQFYWGKKKLIVKTKPKIYHQVKQRLKKR